MNSVIPEFKTLLFEEKEPYIGIVTMNRDDQINAINLDMLKDFETLFHALFQNGKSPLHMDRQNKPAPAAMPASVLVFI